MCEYLDYEVIALRRVRIMNIKLDIPVGEWREFTKEELDTLNSMISDSGVGADSSNTKTISPHIKNRSVSSSVPASAPPPRISRRKKS